MRLLVALGLLLALLTPSEAAKRAKPRALVATVDRLPPEPSLVVATLASGATALDRYRAVRTPGALPADQPLVLLVRLGALNSPDTVTVTASATGRKIVVAVETRRYTGPLAANEVTTPLVEVALGELPAGDYRARISESMLEFDDLAHPERAANPRAGLDGDVSFQVR